MRIFSLFVFGLLFFVQMTPAVSQETCSAQFSSACAVRNAMNLATMTYNDLIKSKTPTQLQNTWHEITWGNKYRIPGGFYAWVFDYADHCKAHGGNPMNVGIELMDIIHRDNFVSTVNLGPVLRAAANITGGSWARYQWANGPSDYPSSRRAWVRKFTLFRIDYYVGVSYVDVDEDWQGMPCQQRRSHFCSVENAKNLADAVAMDLKATCNGSEVDAVLNKINSGTKYRLMDGYYTAVTLFSGPQVANGFNPSFVGKTVQGIAQQLKTFDYIPANLHEQLRFAAANHTGAWVSHPWTNVPTGSTVDTYSYTVYAPALHIDYYVTSSFQNIVDPTCPNCNCIECRSDPVCPVCEQPPEETVTSISFRFKQLTCAGDNC
eukprot:TRINITY_DN3227_c0_g1_i1.p1 TRINITY_DN3227_c0_g1~~TRINITY_DN3227_c0_g1_i1.p1  ORF type:complete len:431 (+),score=130.68 TRINITY_DN3227_c0_g1_i1:165-1295(+)